MTTYLTLEQAREAAADAWALGELIGVPYGRWSGKCHEVSFQLLSTGRFGPGRVARGWSPAVIGQHSWIVLGPDVYASDAVIVDPTITPYLRKHGMAGTNRPGGLPDIQVEYAHDLSHRAHGHGSIWEGQNKPCPGGGPIIELTPGFELSEAAKFFLSEDILGPLDRRGWGQLANGPMQEWPAAEIIRAMYDTPELKMLVPVDIIGMLTDHNPGKCYLTEDLELRP
jgi:hypothetical protein